MLIFDHEIDLLYLIGIHVQIIALTSIFMSIYSIPRRKEEKESEREKKRGKKGNC